MSAICLECEETINMVELIAEYPVQMGPLLTANNIALVFAYITGFQCTEPNWKFNRLSMITCFMMLLAVVSLGYTVVHSTDVFHMIETLCCVSVCAPVTVDDRI